MSDRGSILIVGGGIGGLSASIALSEAGFAVHVVERQPDMRSSVFGVGIIQPTNALRALDVIGCAKACIEQGFPARAWMRRYTVDGVLLNEFPGEQHEWLPPMNGITRPRLHRILTERALQAGVRIEYGKTIESLFNMGDRVEATFSDSEDDDYDIVVGADGVYSFVRELALAPIEPTYIGQSAFRTNIPRPEEVDCIIAQHSPTGTAGIVPLAPDLAYVFLNTPWDRDVRLSDEELYEALRERLEPFGGIIGEVRDKYIDKASDIVLRPEEYLIAPRPWHNGRVVLIGDAVHAVTPTLAQGAAQAIEDGIVLADELGKTNDVQQAFAAYAERRYERCKLIVEGCVQLGEWTETPPADDRDEIELRQRVLDAVAAPI